MAERINQHNTPIIGTNIKRLRTERHLKAVDIIAKLQEHEIYITTGIFSKVEHGYNNPTVEMIIALVDIFQCDYSEFFQH